MTLEVTNFAVDVTLAGIVIVFGMLILLVTIISIFGKMMSGVGNKPKAEKQEKPVAPKVVKNPVAQVNSTVNEDDELIAVISAAIYSMYEGTGVKPVIKAIRPSSNVNPWKYAGVQQNMKSFF